MLRLLMWEAERREAREKTVGSVLHVLNLGNPWHVRQG